MNRMIPRSRSGWWTGWLIAGFAACDVVAGLTSAMVRNSNSSVWQPALTVVALTGLVCILGALVAGIAALFKKDHSAPVFVAVGLGVLAAVFLVCELVVSR